MPRKPSSKRLEVGALAIGAVLAVPVVLLGQEVRCRDCDHVAPYFKGEGGFIGPVADDADKVVFLAICGSVTITGEAAVKGATASQLFNAANGLACDRDDGTFEIAGLVDGGWYWITDARNSAVGNLVAKDVLENPRVPLADAGPGVVATMGRGAVFVKELSTGRVGILPNVLPTPPVPATAPCGYREIGGGAYAAVKSSCMLGDGKTVIRALGVGNDGLDAPLPARLIVRPYAGVAVLKTDLWGNGAGHYSTTANPRLGFPGGAPLRATFSASVKNGPVGVTVSLADAGVAVDSAATTATVGVWNISPSAAYCGTPTAPRNNPVTLRIVASATAPTEVVPAVADTSADAGHQAAETEIVVACPSAV